MSSQAGGGAPSDGGSTRLRGGVFTPHTRVVVRMHEGSNHPYDGRTGEIVGTRKALGVTMCTVRFDPIGADGKAGTPVEMFASELMAAPPAGSTPAAPAAKMPAAPAVAAGSSATNLAPFFDKAYEQQEFADLADAPVDALQGVSQGDAELLRSALGIVTVRDLATNKFVRWAQAIVKFASA